MKMPPNQELAEQAYKQGYNQAEKDLKKNIERILKAWNDKGSHPKYHDQQKVLLLENWRTLYTAIEALNNV